MNPYRKACLDRGVCIDCADVPPSEGRVRCEPCAEKNRKRGRIGAVKGEPRRRHEAAAISSDKDDMIRFIRGQHDIAVPLLAKLYCLPPEEIRKIRGIRIGSALSREWMPIKLLRQLVAQRQREEQMRAEHFMERPSSMSLCEDEA